MTDIASHTGDWFATEFDGSPAVLAVPGTVGSGQDPTLRMVDQFVRGRKIVGRAAAAHSMVGLKVHGAGRPLRVTIEMRLDAVSGQWWTERTAADRTDPAATADPPRLMLVRAQGRIRQGMLLSRAWRNGRPIDTRAVVSLDLAAAEVPEEGLLIVEMLDATPKLPEWAAAVSVPEAPIGVRIDTITVAAVDGAAVDGAARAADAARPAGTLDLGTAQWHGLVSAGGFIGEPERRECGPARTLSFVVNPGLVSARPGPAGVRCRLRLATRSVATEHPPTSAVRSRSLAARARRRATRLVNRWLAGKPTDAPISVDRVEVRAVCLTDGSSVPVSTTRVADGLEVAVPPGVPGPVLVNVVPPPAATPDRPVMCEIVAVEV